MNGILHMRLLLGAGLFFLYACGPQVSPAQRSNLPKTKSLKAQMIDRMAQEKSITLIYGTADKEIAQKYKNLSEELAKRIRYFEVHVVPETILENESLPRTPYYLLGSPRQNRSLHSLLTKLPLTIDNEGVSLFDKNHSLNSVAVISFFPSPGDPTVPMGLISGNNDDEILQWMGTHLGGRRSNRLLPRTWDYEFFQDGQRMRMGDFAIDSSDPSKIHSQNEWDLSASPQKIMETTLFDFFYFGKGIQEEQIKVRALKLQQQGEAYFSHIGYKPSGKKRSVFLYHSLEHKTLKTGKPGYCHYDEINREIHWVIGAPFKEDEPLEPFLLLQEESSNSPKIKALADGIAIRYTDSWQGGGYAYWGRRLFESGNLPGLHKLLDNKKYEFLGKYVGPASSGLLCDFLLSPNGIGLPLEKIKDWNPRSEDMAKMTTLWHKYLSNRFANRLPIAKDIYTDQQYLQGFNFAHEGYQVYNSYGSRKAKESIAFMKSLHANAMAIVPYTSMRDPKVPVPLFIPKWAGGENDESVIMSIHDAREMGMESLLKPQIWVGRSWPGDIEMQTEEDWEKFFDHYGDWILHYTMMAEMYGIKNLCVGVEMAKTTLQKPDKWRSLIRKLRKLYSGNMVYAANWGEEFEQLNFWDELDYIGLDCYYPLSKKEVPEKKELRKSFERTLDKIEDISKKYDKKVWFTEVGFRSVKAPWMQPHEEAGDKLASEADQSQCYEIIFNCLKDEPHIQGIFWWKWPSYLSYGTRDSRRFSPYGKKAMYVVEKHFQENL